MTRGDVTTALQQEVESQRAQLEAAHARVAKLEESELRYRLFTEASLAGIYMIQDGKFSYVNERAAALLGYMPCEVVGRPIEEVVAPESRAVVAASIGKRLDGEASTAHYRATVFHKQGHRVEVEVYGTVSMLDGRPALLGTFVDRTEENRAERALRASEERFQAFMDNSPTIAFMKDAEGRYVYGNRLYHELLGLAPGTIVGKHTNELFLPETVAQMSETDYEVAAAGKRVQYVLTVPRADGEHQYLVLKFPVTDPSGQRLVGGVALDLTERIRTEEALAEKTRILQSILDSMSDGVTVTNEKGEFIIFNPAAQRITGLGPRGTTAAEWVEHFGMHEADTKTKVTAPDDIPLARALRGEHTDDAEFFLQHQQLATGAWVSVSARPLLDEEKRSRGAVVVFRDITERRRTLDELRRTEEKLRALIEQLPVCIYTSSADPAQGVFYISPQIETITGYGPEEFQSQPQLRRQLVHADDLPGILAALGSCQHQGDRFMAEYRLQHRDGTWIWVHDASVLICDAEGEPSLLQGVLLDITERMQERGRRERLQSLSLDLVAVQEAERRRMGLELHDEVGQILTGLKLRLSEFDRVSPEEQLQRLQEVNQLLDEATVRVRELSQSLRPSVLDDLGLLPALASHFTRYTRDTGVRVEFEHEGIDRRRFAPDAETAAYRIVQEALTNAARHAQVRSVRVRAWADVDHLGVQIEDEGPGFDAEAALARGRTRGLAGMRERAALLNGSLTVDAQPGRGCRITAEFPIDES
jgi:PAS domain S-box-containing protein